MKEPLPPHILRIFIDLGYADCPSLLHLPDVGKLHLPKRRELLLPTRFGLDETTHELYYAVETYATYETRQINELEMLMRGPSSHGLRSGEVYMSSEPEYLGGFNPCGEIKIDQKPLSPARMFMSQADWEDILKLPKEKP